MNTLYPEVRRTVMPDEYYVSGTKEYVDFKRNLIKETKRKIKKWGLLWKNLM